MDYYIKTTKDLLLDANIAASSGFATATLNVGKLRNNGFELTLETTNVKTKDFNWTSNFNIAFNKNKIISLNSGQEDITSYITWDNKYRTTPAYISKRVKQQAKCMVSSMKELINMRISILLKKWKKGLYS